MLPPVRPAQQPDLPAPLQDLPALLLDRVTPLRVQAMVLQPDQVATPHVRVADRLPDQAATAAHREVLTLLQEVAAVQAAAVQEAEVTAEAREAAAQAEAAQEAAEAEDN